MFLIKPGFGLFRRFPGVWTQVFHSFPHFCPHPGERKPSGRGAAAGASDSFLPCGQPRNGPARACQAAAVRSSHTRRSRRRAFSVTVSFRMTAVTATLWGFPLSLSRAYISFMSGLNAQAAIAAM